MNGKPAVSDVWQGSHVDVVLVVQWRNDLKLNSIEGGCHKLEVECSLKPERGVGLQEATLEFEVCSLSVADIPAVIWAEIIDPEILLSMGDIMVNTNK